MTVARLESSQEEISALKDKPEEPQDKCPEPHQLSLDISNQPQSYPKDTSESVHKATSSDDEENNNGDIGKKLDSNGSCESSEEQEKTGPSHADPLINEELLNSASKNSTISLQDLGLGPMHKKERKVVTQQESIEKIQLNIPNTMKKTTPQNRVQSTSSALPSKIHKALMTSAVIPEKKQAAKASATLTAS